MTRDGCMPHPVAVVKGPYDRPSTSTGNLPARFVRDVKHSSPLFSTSREPNGRGNCPSISTHVFGGPKNRS